MDNMENQWPTGRRGRFVNYLLKSDSIQKFYLFFKSDGLQKYHLFEQRQQHLVLG